MLVVADDSKNNLRLRLGVGMGCRFLYPRQDKLKMILGRIKRFRENALDPESFGFMIVLQA